MITSLRHTAICVMLRCKVGQRTDSANDSENAGDPDSFGYGSCKESRLSARVEEDDAVVAEEVLKFALFKEMPVKEDRRKTEEDRSGCQG